MVRVNVQPQFYQQIVVLMMTMMMMTMISGFKITPVPGTTQKFCRACLLGNTFIASTSSPTTYIS